jgi:hypothetical protein
VAFPTVTTVLDSFNRANESPLSASAGWDQNDYFGGTSNLLRLASNQALKLQVAAAGWGAQVWGTAYGPDTEAYATIAAKPGVDTYEILTIYARLVQIGSTVDGYCVQVLEGTAGTDEWLIFRVDNNSFTQLGATVTQEVTVGDKIGLEIIGSTIKGYLFTGGSWTEVISRSDSNHTAAGKVCLEVRGVNGRLDDFVAGTVVTGGGGSSPRLLGTLGAGT